MAHGTSNPNGGASSSSSAATSPRDLDVGVAAQTEMLRVSPKPIRPGAAKKDAGLKLTSLAGKKGSTTKVPGESQHDPPGDDDDGEDSEDEVEAWKRVVDSGPHTPNIAEAAKQLRRSLSVHGLHQLATMPPRQITSKFWRPHNEEAKLPLDWERVMVHVAKGALRGFSLAFLLRGGIYLALGLIKTIRTRNFDGRALALSLFGPANVRFSFLMSVWTALYKAIHNSLRLMTPLPPRRSSRSRSVTEGLGVKLESTPGRTPSPPSPTTPQLEGLSGVQTPRSGYEQLEGTTGEERAKIKAKQRKKAFMRDPRSKVWHAYLAGAISGLAILVETKSGRMSLGQQLVVRGLEGTYNVAHGMGLINIPHGAVLTFGLACGQIMYAWMNSPDSLNRGYANWITQASRISPDAVGVQQSQHLKTDQQCIDAALRCFPNQRLPDKFQTRSGRMMFPHVPPTARNRRGATSSNVEKISQWIEDRKAGKPREPYVPCYLAHPWEDSHTWRSLDAYMDVMRFIMPVYMTLHFVPAIVLRFGAFSKDPLRIFLRSLFGSVRSSSFLAMYVVIYMAVACWTQDFYEHVQKTPALKAIFPSWFLNTIVGGPRDWFAGFLTCLSLFVEHKRRRVELAMYVLPKGAESAWFLARKRGWVPRVPHGDVLLTCMGMSMIMGTYAQSPEHLSGIVRRVVYQFVGHN